ncbi:ATP-binding protein [Primorskyibacter marinus]|uniref:ATP-binding protein n=1 Tax=Primorskyibacter marinus TaxID=1977320 RepID=UPI000E305D20|nr:AAA family ATPase [Primorskyibacter marinus]
MIRLRRLDLELFGQFSGKSYDFGPRLEGAPDFHLIHGPNEAGKTTTMEGFLRLLYGFPLREPYAFQHDRKTLRISGVLDLGDAEIGLTRLPTRNANLVDAQGKALPEQVLAAHLGGLGLDDYRNLLCLDDETIERGGEEIASAKGDIGRLLFSAAAGISDLTEVLDSVRARAEALYKKRSSKTRMAELKAELKEIDHRIRDKDVTAAAYRSLRQARDHAAQEEAETGKIRAAHASEYAATLAKRDALPMLAEIDGLDRIISAHPGYPDRLDIDPETLVSLLSEQRQAEADQERLTRDIEELEAQRDGVVRHPEHLALGAALDDLDDLRSRHATAGKDLPKRRRTLEEVRTDMALAARDLGAAEGTDPETLVLAPGALAQLETARDAKRTAMQAAGAARDELARLAERIAGAEAAITSQDEEGAPDIAAVLDRFSVDTLAPRHAAAQQAVAEAERDCAEARDALLLKGQGFANLPVCPLTSDEAAALAATHAQLSGDLRATEDAIEILEAESADRSIKIDGLGSAAALLGDEAARALRERRDALWQSHRETMTDASADPFEAAMRQVDAAAASRLDHASELGQLRHLEEDARRAEHRIQQAKAKRDALVANVAEVEGQLTDAAREAGVDASLTPPAFAAWVARLTEAQAAEQRLDRIRAEHANVFGQAAHLSRALSASLDLENPDFETLLATARNHAAEARKLHEAAQNARARLRDLQAERKRRQAHLVECEKADETARSVWAEAVAENFGGAVQGDALDRSFAPLRNLRELDTRRTSIARQIDAMEADQRDFAQAVAALAGASDLSDPLAVFADLRVAADQAQAAEKQHADTLATLRRHHDARDVARRALDAVETKMQDIASFFPKDADTTTLDALRKTVGQAQQVIDAKARRAALLTKLCLTLNVADLTAARSMVDDVTDTSLAAQLMQLNGDGKAIEDRYRDTIATRSAADRDLRAVTGDADIAMLAERKATIELEMQETALAYLELHLGHDLAEEAIRRYRDTHRSGMMKATETAFSDLTNGAYTRLMTQPDGGAETLIALDPAGQSKQAQDMSKGTRFQLYLALRAAAYEQLAQQGTVLPFFCDDIFETFDEDRTRAACHVMARIGRTGQAIYLTHHRHVVDIARQVCGDALRVHEI